MVQTSGPISQGTASERQLTDVLWRDIFGDESGVIGDTNGTAYYPVLPPDSDVASIGSQQIDSMARVAGFGHKIPATQPETIQIPAAVGSTRTDIIALRYDPSYTGLPGPVRLIRIAGTSASVPAYDDNRPGVEDLPLYSVTRQVGQNLSQATVIRMYPRITPTLTIDSNAPLPPTSPIGTLLRRGSERYVRSVDGQGNGVWVSENPFVSSATNPANLSLTSATNAAGTKPTCYWREQKTVHLVGIIQLNSNLAGLGSRSIGSLPSGFRPNATVAAPTNFEGRFQVASDGAVSLVNGSTAQIPANVAIPINMAIPLA